MITKPEDMNFDNKKFSVLLYGAPGVGKTTLALSAPEPILIDFDRGMSRVKTQHRKTAIFCEKYEDVLADLESPEMKDFQTVIVDTGGSFVSFLQDWAMRTNPTVNKQKNGAISLKGFGAVKSEFVRFTDHVKSVLNKNIIYVFHNVEQTDKDGNVQQRLMCEGAAKNIVWTPCDFGGYVQMIGEQRVVSFAPEQEFFAKGCHGINGKYKIPALGESDENDFLTKIFNTAKANIAAENEAYAPLKEQYETVMAEARKIIEGITDADTANEASAKILDMNHALTSKKEASAMLKDKAAALKLKFVNGKCVPKETEPAPED